MEAPIRVLAYTFRNGMLPTPGSRLLRCVLFLMLCIPLRSTKADAVHVKFTEGISNGFLALSALDGKRIADGDLEQKAQGDHVTATLIFKFKDGSYFDETTTYSQRDTFRVLTDHVLQRGPSFQPQMEASLDATSGRVTIRISDKNGKEKTSTQKLAVPADLANGILLTLLKNIDPPAASTVVSFVALSEKARLVKFDITSAGEETVLIGSSRNKAQRYVVKVKIGAASGALARITGKQPPDIHVWMLKSDAPTFLKLEGPLYVGGPIWRIELAKPSWPQGP